MILTGSSLSYWEVWAMLDIGSECFIFNNNKLCETFSIELQNKNETLPKKIIWIFKKYIDLFLFIITISININFNKEYIFI